MKMYTVTVAIRVPAYDAHRAATYAVEDIAEALPGSLPELVSVQSDDRAKLGLPPFKLSEVTTPAPDCLRS